MNACLETSTAAEQDWLRQAAEVRHAPAMHAFAFSAMATTSGGDGCARPLTKATFQPCMTTD